MNQFAKRDVRTAAKSFVAVLIISSVLTSLILIFLVFPIKRKFKQAKNRLKQHILSVVKMDSGKKALLDDIEANWLDEKQLPTKSYLESLNERKTGTSDSNSFVSISTNKHESSKHEILEKKYKEKISLLIARNLRETVDKRIHFSEDGKTAMIRVNSYLVFTFEGEK